MCLDRPPDKAHFTYSRVRTRIVDVFRWKDVEVDGAVSAVPLRGEQRGFSSTEDNFLQHSIITPELLQTLPERTAQKPETKQKLVPRNEVAALTAEEVQRQRHQSLSEPTSKLCCMALGLSFLGV